MVAATIGLGLLLVIFGFLVQALRMSEIMISRVNLNAEARLAFDLVANGGVINGAPPEEVAGIRGSGDIGNGVLSPGGAAVGRMAQKLVIDAGATGALESTELNAPIICDAAGSPHPDCVVAGEATIRGYLASDAGIDATVRNLTIPAHCGGGSRPATAEVSVEMIDPRLLRANEDFVAAQYRIEYHNVLAFHVDCL
ncbi:MAG: hypothetical protein H6980_06770 [Gammaproteobacteria bacterium]|nr:hypothetical protein [Gammaproteobacteria bacterium]